MRPAELWRAPNRGATVSPFALLSLRRCARLRNREVQHSFSVVDELHKRWKEILKSASGKGSEEYKWTTSELLSGLRSIEWDLQDLNETIGIVQANRAQFGLSDAEVKARKAFVDGMRASLTSMRAEVISVEPAEATPGKTGSAAARGATKKAGTERESLLASDSGGGSNVAITVRRRAARVSPPEPRAARTHSRAHVLPSAAPRTRPPARRATRRSTRRRTRTTRASSPTSTKSR
jgi:hypothetical protein